MLNHEPFLAAICANPDDDAPRLVYADWLEEHGETARAEFIRVQIELAGLSEESNRRAALVSRQNALMRSHKKEWAAPLRGSADSYEFMRGFVMWVTMPAERFPAAADALFRLSPVRAICFSNPVAFMHQVAGCPPLANLTWISFRSQYTAAVAATTGNPFSEMPTTIGLPDDRLGDIDLEALVSSAYLTSLSWLTLDSCNISPDGIRSLLASPIAPRLTRLNLHGNRIGDEGAQAIAETENLRNLELLDLSNTGIGMTLGEMFERLLRRLRGAPSEPAQRSPLRTLAASPHFPKLRYVNVRGNRLFEADKRALRARFGAHAQL